MPDPTRPVAGAPIDTDWGQQVHDRIFEPPGVRVADSDVQAVGSTYEQLGLDTVVDDPGGWLSGDTLTVPTGRGGLYLINTLVHTQDGGNGFNTVVQVRVNGTSRVKYSIGHDDSGAVQTGGGIILIELSAGDDIEWWAKRSGGSAPGVKVLAADCLIQGTGIGA